LYDQGLARFALHDHLAAALLVRSGGQDEGLGFGHGADVAEGEARTREARRRYEEVLKK